MALIEPITMYAPSFPATISPDPYLRRESALRVLDLLKILAGFLLACLATETILTHPPIE